MKYKNGLEDYLKFEETNEEKNLEEKDPKNNIDSKQTQTFEDEKNKNISKLKAEENKNIYKLFYSAKKDITKLNCEEIINYIDNNYLLKTKPKREHLLKDLITFKTYREEIKIRLNNLNFFDNILDKIMLVLSIIAAVAVANKVITLDVLRDAKEVLEELKASGENAAYIEEKIKNSLEFYDKMSCNLFWVLLIAVVICMLTIILFCRYRINKNSFGKKLNCLNNAIYKLEVIKDNNFVNPIKISIKKTDTNVDVFDSSCDKSESGLQEDIEPEKKD